MICAPGFKNASYGCMERVVKEEFCTVGGKNCTDEGYCKVSFMY